MRAALPLDAMGCTDTVRVTPVYMKNGLPSNAAGALSCRSFFRLTSCAGMGGPVCYSALMPSLSPACSSPSCISLRLLFATRMTCDRRRAHVTSLRSATAAPHIFLGVRIGFFSHVATNVSGCVKSTQGIKTLLAKDVVLDFCWFAPVGIGL